MSVAGGVYRKFRSPGIHHQRTPPSHAATAFGGRFFAPGYPMHQCHQSVRRDLRPSEWGLQHRIPDDIPAHPIRRLQIIYELHGNESADLAVRKEYLIRALLHFIGIYRRRI